jgi:hypothetical protein
VRTDSYMSTRSARAKTLMLPTFWAIARKLVEACQRPSRQHQEHYSDWADRTRADGPVLLTLTRGICGTSTAAARGAAALRASPLPSPSRSAVTYMCHRTVAARAAVRQLQFTEGFRGCTSHPTSSTGFLCDAG